MPAFTRLAFPRPVESQRVLVGAAPPLLPVFRNRLSISFSVGFSIGARREEAEATSAAAALAAVAFAIEREREAR